MESMDLAELEAFFAGKRVWVTGDSGFKGSWLTLWLRAMGAKVQGLSRNDVPLFDHLGFAGVQASRSNVDISQTDAVIAAATAFNPDIVFHLAAQPLVRAAYREPVATWGSNVMGTVNVLEACRTLNNLKAVVVVSSDKCYENPNDGRPFTENDRLGGHDPYSASKAATEGVAHSFAASFGLPIATARAGNVIGGGDFAEDRLIPDWARALHSGQQMIIRNSAATRPWQHVLDCLHGYLRLAYAVALAPSQYVGPWNFGPPEDSVATVAELLSLLDQEGRGWTVQKDDGLYEAQTLQLNSEKSAKNLNWQTRQSLQQSCTLTCEWYQAWLQGKCISQAQLTAFRHSLA